MAARSRIPTFAGRKNPLGVGTQILTQENASSKKRARPNAPAPSVQSPNPKARKILRTSTSVATPAQKRAHPSPPPPSTSRKRPKTSEDVDPMDCIVPPEPSRSRSTTGFDIPLTKDQSLLGEPGPDISSGGLYSDFEEQETWMLKSMVIGSPALESPPRRKSTRQSTVTPRSKATPRQRSTTPRRRQSTPRRYEPKTLPPPIVTPTAAQARKEARLAALQAEAEAKLRASVESDGLGELSVVGEEDEEDEDTVRPEDDEDTVGDERTVRQDEEDPLAWDTPPRSQASNASTPRAGASTTPRTLASTTPRTLPSTTPRTLPSTTPKTLPSTTPRTRPSTTPKTLPSTTPRTLPSTTPKTLPSTTPRARPTTTPATASSSRTKNTTVHFPSSDHDESESESEYDPPTDVSEPVAEEGEVSRSTRSRPSIGTELARLSITEGEQEGPDEGQPGSDEQGTDGEQGDTDEEGNISTRTRSRASLAGALKRMESLQLHEERDEDEEPPVRSPFKRGRGRGATRGRGRVSSQRSDVFGSPQRQEEEEHGGNVSVRGRGRGSGSRRRSSSRGGRSPSRGGHSPTRGARGGRGGRGRGRASPTRSSPRKPTTTPIKSPMRVEVVVPVRRRRSSGESRVDSSGDLSQRTDGDVSQRTDGDDSQDSDEDVTRHTDGNDSRYTDGDLSQRTDGDVTRGTEGDSLPSDEDLSDEDVNQEADVTQSTNRDASRRASGDASSRTGMDISRRTSGNVSQRSSMDVSRRTSGGVTARTGMDISRRTSGDISRLSSMDVSRRTSANVSRHTSADVSQRSSMDISRRTSATNQTAIFPPDDTIIAPAPSSSAPSGSNASYAPTNTSFSSAKPSSASAVGSVTLQQPTPDYSSLDQSPGGRQEDMEDTGTEVPETSLPGTPADDEFTQLNDTRDLSAEHTRKSIGVSAHQTLSNLLREQQRRTSMNSSLAGATPGMKRSTFKKTPARSGGLKILPESHPTPGTSLSLSQLRPTTGQASRSYAVESIQASTSYTLKTSQTSTSIQPPTSNTFQPRISQASQSFRPSQSTQPFRPTQSTHTPHPTQATRSFRLRTINDSVDIDIELSPDQSRSMRSEFEFNAQSTPFVRGARPSLGLGAFERLGIGEMTVDEDEDPDVDVEGSDRDEEEQREGSQVDEEENRRQEEQAEQPLGQEDDAQSDAHSSDVIDETPEPGTREISVVLDTSSPHRSLRTERVPTPRAGRISQVEESDSDEGPPLPPSPSAGRSSFHEGDSGSITGRRLSDILKIRAQQVRDRSGRSADTSGDLTASGELTRLSDQAQDVLDTSNTSERRLNLAGSSSGRVSDVANSSKALERSAQKGNRSDASMTSRASTSRVQQASERETTQDYDASVRFDGPSRSAIQRSGTPVFRSGQTPSQHEDEDDQSMTHLDDSGEGQRSSGASVHSSGRSQEGDLTGADGEQYERSEDEELDYDENGEPIIKISGPPEAVVRAKSALLQAGYTEDEEILEQYSRSRSERSRSRSVSRARSTSRAAESSVRHVSVASTSYGHFIGDRTSGLSRSQMMAEASRYEDWEPPSRRQLRTRKWTEHDWRMLAHYMRRVQKSQALTSGLSSRQELDLRMVDIPAVVERFIEEEGHGIKLEGEWDPAEIAGRTEFLIQTEGYKKDGSWRTTLMSMTAHGFPGSSTQRHEDEEAEEESPPRNRMLPAALAEQPGRKRAAAEPKRDVWSVFGEPSPAPSNEEPEAPVEEEAEEQPVEEEQEEQEEQDPGEDVSEEVTYEDEPYPDEPREEGSREEESYEQPDEPEAEEPLDEGASDEEQYESIGGTRLPLSVTVSPERARQARQPRPHVDVSVPTNRRLDTSLRSQQGGPSTPMARFIGSISSFITGRSQNGQANTSGPQLKPVSRNPIDLTHVEDEDEPRFPVLNHVPTPVRPTPARNRRQKRVEPRIDARPLQHVSPPRPAEPPRPRPPIRRVGSVKELAKSFEIMEENSRKEAELARTVGAQSRRVVSESSRPNRAVPVFMPTQKAPISAPAPQPPAPAPVRARPRAAARTRRAGIPSPTKKRPKVEPEVITISDSED